VSSKDVEEALKFIQNYPPQPVMIVWGHYFYSDDKDDPCINCGKTLRNAAYRCPGGNLIEEGQKEGSD
jgi:hypothetical protein